MELKCWRHEQRGSVDVFFFDQQDRKQNILNKDALEELMKIFGQNHDAVVLCSGKQNFCTGADINEIMALRDSPQKARAVLEKVGTFARGLRKKPYPIITAVTGLALGGGFELAMWTHAIVAAKNASFQLPETGLGIIPGFGGTQLLPRLIGEAKAFEAIFSGKKLKASEAHAAGLVHTLADDVVTSAVDLAEAMRDSRAKIPELPHKSPSGVWFGPIGRMWARKIAKAVAKKNIDLYPALMLAYDAIVTGAKNLETGWAREVDNFLRALSTKTARSLIGLYFLKEKARRAPRTVPPTEPIKHLGVVGAGLMGRDIAYTAICANIPVLLVDRNDVDGEKQVAAALYYIEALLKKQVRRGEFTAKQAEEKLKLLTTSFEGYASLHNCDFVIEAVVENLNLKRSLFMMFEEVVSPDTILASNTSSLLPSEIAEGLQHPERVCAMHFFQPAYRRELVEIAGHADTKPEVVARTLHLARAMGKIPIELNKEARGLIVNRPLVKGILRALEGVIHHGVDPYLLDRACEKLGMTMGPIETLDLVGHDTALRVRGIIGVPFFSFVLQEELLGKKTGKGFYIWGKGDRAEKPNYDYRTKFCPDATGNESLADSAARGILSIMAAECLNIYQQGICTDPDTIDLAIVLGAGICPHRRGLLVDTYHIAQKSA